MSPVHQFLADEDFDNRILRGIESRRPDLDIVRAQTVGLSGALDPLILEWAADEGRILLTHDASTMRTYAYERVGAGLAMPGVFVIGQWVPLRQAIDEVLLVAECSQPAEWEGQVRHLPL